MKDQNATHSSRFIGFSLCALAGILIFSLSPAANATSASAYVRVNQVGYETANAPFQAYLMSTASEAGATFTVNTYPGGATVYSGPIGAKLGTWSNSKTLT